MHAIPNSVDRPAKAGLLPENNSSHRNSGGAVDWSEVTHELVQLAQLRDRFHQFGHQKQKQAEARAGKQNYFKLSHVLREATASASLMAKDLARVIDLETGPEGMVSGSADDLREAVIRLLQNSLSYGRGALHVKMRIEGGDKHRRPSAVIEVFNEQLDVPDCSRRQLFKAVSAYGGETCFVSDSAGFRVRIILPLLAG